ncbi:ImmA/IrrE family metallo-endopeptidase [Metabacillus fastidiosus]|uniref:ImmA/IrrE family metallo-endopeptidase n=1 Tax=Metabacillus fastidiosus TaxID=1458 RepID=UPI003D2C429C
MNYQLTQLEENIKNLYINLGIELPYEIDIYHISNELDIWIYFHPHKSEIFKRNGLFSMFLDEELSVQEQWQDFGHELGHIIRHTGNQHKLAIPFRALQENQANNFMYHFCVPTFMLLNYEINNFMNINDGISFISKAFNVTEEFAKRRLVQFKNQIYQAKSDEEHRRYMESLYPKINPENYADETKSLLNKLYIQLDKKKDGAVR